MSGSGENSMNERFHLSTRPRHAWLVVVIAAAIGVPLVVVAPVLAVLVLIGCALSAALMAVGSLPTATGFLAASVGLLVPVSLYFGRAIR
jgi:hypothetical protein